MFVWKSSFELGIPSIDQQHKELFEIGNRVLDLLVTKNEDIDDFDEIIDLAFQLKAYTQYHFQTEEKLFEKYDYPDREAHIQSHDTFIKYIDQFDFSNAKLNQREVLDEMLDHLSKWIFNHIITTDYMYKTFLIEKGIR